MSMPELWVQCQVCSRQSSSVLRAVAHPCEYDRSNLNLGMIWNIFFPDGKVLFPWKRGQIHPIQTLFFFFYLCVDIKFSSSSALSLLRSKLGRSRLSFTQIPAPTFHVHVFWKVFPSDFLSCLADCSSASRFF